MADMKYVRAFIALLALAALAASIFSGILSVIGGFITYSVYKGGVPAHGVTPHSFGVREGTLIVATGLLFWAWLKIWPKRLG
jgi:hypothetical protein